MNCSSQASNLTCVQTADSAVIKKIIEQNSLRFYPIPDNVTLFASPANRRGSGQFAAVPVPVGNSAQVVSVYAQAYTSFPQCLSKLLVTERSEIPFLEAAYPVGNVTGVNDYVFRIDEFGTLLEAQCPVGLWVNEIAAAAPNWRYIYDAYFPNQQPVGHRPFYAYHASEVPLVFGTYPGGPVNPTTAAAIGALPWNLPPTAQEEALSALMNHAFAKNPSAGPGWSRVGSSGATLVT